LHLIVEAASGTALTKGLRSFQISAAMQINGVLSARRSAASHGVAAAVLAPPHRLDSIRAGRDRRSTRRARTTGARRPRVIGARADRATGALVPAEM